MNEELLKGLYFFYFLIARPFKAMNNWFAKADKSKNLLKMMIILTVLSLFIESLWELYNMLPPVQWNDLTNILLAITLIIYVWKYADPKYGRSWLIDYKRWRERKQ